MVAVGAPICQISVGCILEPVFTIHGFSRCALNRLRTPYGAHPDDHTCDCCEQRKPVKQKAPNGIDGPFICFDAYTPFISSVGSTFSSV